MDKDYIIHPVHWVTSTNNFLFLRNAFAGKHSWWLLIMEIVISYDLKSKRIVKKKHCENIYLYSVCVNWTSEVGQTLIISNFDGNFLIFHCRNHGVYFYWTSLTLLLLNRVFIKKDIYIYIFHSAPTFTA